MGKCLQIIMERKIIVDSAELKELLLDLKNLDKEIVELVNESEERQKQFETKTMLRQKIVDKIKPVTNECMENDKITLGEYEIITNVTIDEKEIIELKIVDELEYWKEERRKSKEVKIAPAEKVETLAEKTD